MSYYIPDGTTVTMNSRELVFGSTIEQMQDTDDIREDTAALQACLAKEGYLLFRNFHDREQIMKARGEILAYMSEEDMLRPDGPVEEGGIGPGNRSTIFRHKIIQDRFPSFLEVVNSDRIITFFERYLSGGVLSLDHKWLRAVGHGVHTNAHCDVVYMGKGTKQLYTVWTAFDDITLDMGPLAVNLGSHQRHQLKATYGASDAHDDLETGWLSDDPHEVTDMLDTRWASTSFTMGDVVIFGMYFLHGSLDNTSVRYRLSSDTRYQLASEPVDVRHMGDTPDEIPKAADRKTMAQARREWGI